MPGDHTLRFRLEADPDGVIRAVEEATAAVKAGAQEMDKTRATPEVDLDISELLQKKKVAMAELKALAKAKSEAKAGMDTKVFDAQAAKVQAVIDHIDGQVAEVEVRVNRSELNRGSRAMQQLGKDVDESNSKIVQWARSVSKMRLSMGPLSGTVRQFGIAFTLLGPIIAQLIGGLSALVGVVGSGAVGAFAASTAAAGGFALSAVGIGLVIKPLIGQLTAASKASTAYSAAVLKYGKGSTQAKTALDALNQTLKGMSPNARQTVKDWSAMKTQWAQLTKPSAGAFWDAAASGMKTLHTLMPNFAKQTNATMKTLSQGIQSWMHSLRSPEAQAAINQMMSGFRGALPGIMDGLGTIVGMLGRIGASASKLLPSLTGGFAQWAQNLSDAAGSGAKLDAWVSKTIGHMQDIGHLAQASGRLMVGFFGAGADAGDGMVQSLTRVMNRWNDWIRSTGGQNSLHKFFDQSAKVSGQLVATLAHLGVTLFHLGKAAAPLSDALVKISDIISSITAAVSSNPLGKLFIQGAALGLVFLAIVNKIRGALLGMEALSIGGMFGGLFGRTAATTIAETGAAAGAAQAELTGFAAASGAAEGGAMGLGAAAATVALPLAGIALGGFALGAVLDANSMSFDELTRSMNRNLAASKAAGAKLPGLVADLSKRRQHSADVVGSLADAEAKLNRIEKQHGAGAPLAIQQQQKVNQIQEGQSRALAKQADVYRQIINRKREDHRASQRAIDDAKQQVEAARAAHGISGRGGGPAASATLDKIAEAQKHLNQARQAGAASDGRLAFAELQVARVQQGHVPLLKNLSSAYSKLQQNIGAAAAKHVGSFVKPGDVSQVTNLSNRLTRLGQGKTVKDIVVNAGSAKQAIAALQNLQRITIRDKKMEVRHNTNTVIQAVRTLLGLKLSPKTQRIADSGGTTVLTRLAAILGFRLPGKTQKVIADAQPVFSLFGQLAGTVLPAIIQPIVSVFKGKRAEGGPMVGVPMGRSGGKVSSPRYVVGEEAPQHPEYVIATNPAYRENNKMYLDQAASALGYSLVPGFKTGGIKKAEEKAHKAATKSAKEKSSPGGKKITKKEESHIKKSTHAAGKVAYDNIVARRNTKWENQYTKLTDRLDESMTYLDLYDTTGDAPNPVEFSKWHANAVERVNTLIGYLVYGIGHPARTGKASTADLNARLAQANATLGVINKNQYGEEGATDAGSEGPTLGEQTATSNQARAAFQRQFGSNIIGGIVSGIPALSGGLAAAVAPASQGYYPQGGVTAFPGGSSLTGPNENPGRIINISNNFAAPPPDPHTWTQQQNFEAQAAM